MKLDTLENEVEHILTTDEKTRGDDMALYFAYLCRHDVGILKVFTDKAYRVANGISSFESVSRCRRKLQATYIELRPSDPITHVRAEEEKEFRAYAKRGKEGK